jgi:small GTP-binding protein
MSDRSIPVILLGTTGAGKTSLISRLCDDTFTDSPAVALSPDFRKCDFDIDGSKLKYNLWDTPGNEKFNNINLCYIPRVFGAAVVYSVTERDSLQNAARWIEELRTSGRSGMPIFLFGNKSDLSELSLKMFEV